MSRNKTLLFTLSVALLIVGCGGPQTAPAASSAQTTTAPTVVPTVSLSGFATPDPAGLPTPTSEAAEEMLYTVQRGEVVSELTLQGRVANVERGIAFSEAGIVEAVYVDLGGKVEAGQLLAELDSEDLQASLIQAQSEYAQHQAAINRFVGSAQMNVRRAELTLEEARSKLDEVKQSASAEEITAAEVAVRQAESSLATVRNDASRAKNTAKQLMDMAVVRLGNAQSAYALALDAVNRSSREQADSTQQRLVAAEGAVREAEVAVRQAVIDYDTARNNEVAAVQTAEATLDLARAKLETLRRGADPFLIAAAERNVRQAEIAVQEARLSAQPDPGLVRQAQVAEAAIENLERQLEARKLYAPGAGEVIAMEIAPGSAVSLGAPVIVIGTADAREIVADLPSQADLLGNPRLVVGQTVDIIFPRYPDQKIVGTVARVPGVRDRGDAGGLGSSYAISYDTSRLATEIGDLAEVRVMVGQSASALWLPPEAVRTTRTRTFVVLRDDSGDRRVDVEIGLTSPERVEILRGLSEGDTVVGSAATR